MSNDIIDTNIYRYKMREETMQRLEERRTKKNVEQYSEAGAAISRSMEKTEDIPTLTEVIDSIQTKEELEQLRKLVRTTLGENRAIAEASDSKKSGGK